MELKGKIVAVLDQRNGVSKSTGKEWVSREFVMEIDGDPQYKKHFVFNVFGSEKLQAFDIKLGDNVSIECDVDASEYKGRWFNKFNAYKVYKAAGSQRDYSNTQPKTGTDSQQVKKQSIDEDMPF